MSDYLGGHQPLTVVTSRFIIYSKLQTQRQSREVQRLSVSCFSLQASHEKKSGLLKYKISPPEAEQAQQTMDRYNKRIINEKKN
jgi:hypothetical protein